MQYEAVVIGVSAGGLAALSGILKELPVDFALPVIIIQHRSREERTLLEEVMQAKCRIRIKQADEKERIERSVVYFAPADYHLLIEKDRSFSLSRDMPVNFSRPSVDVLFMAASEVYGDRLIAMILTGAGKDGAEGVRAVRQRGGLTVAQDPEDAFFPDMPRAAIETGCVQYILKPTELKNLLLNIGGK
ncbi:chemotaxis protein CheB [Puia dinghuensis]|uniref:protein-glutamate methylesterase n=1 Tax=Puia dinghuensis TaxID=1792502 RepID=A0A8J2U7V9_9BACT|nr:chemotaxis protein CheB [Puia dinghuensis]GGA85248.1 putative chemotaxis protein-glutamate methylesterase [Puia dinghuensis]